MSEELRYHPKATDPAFDAGYHFVDRHMETGDAYVGPSPLWHGWMVRQAFWCGVKWAREQRSLPVVGKITDDGILWSAGD